MPEPNTGLFFFWWHLQKLRFPPMVDLSSTSFLPQCYLCDSKPLIQSNYMVILDTVSFPKVCLPFLSDYETDREEQCSEKSCKIRIQRSLYVVTWRPLWCQMRFPPPVFSISSPQREILPQLLPNSPRLSLYFLHETSALKTNHFRMKMKRCESCCQLE